MKTRCFKVGWLIPVLGIGVVVGFLMAATTYRGFERQAELDSAFMPTLDRLCNDYTLSQVLRMLHDGGVDEAAQRLDLLLCWDILRQDTELASADHRTRAWVEDTFRRIARVRPKMAKGAAGASDLVTCGARAEAERVLERALTASQRTNRAGQEL